MTRVGPALLALLLLAALFVAVAVGDKSFGGSDASEPTTTTTVLVELAPPHVEVAGLPLSVEQVIRDGFAVTIPSLSYPANGQGSDG